MGNEALSNIVKTTYFTRENAHFIDKDGLLALKSLRKKMEKKKNTAAYFCIGCFRLKKQSGISACWTKSKKSWES